jgi:hypothetical protein
MSPELVLALFVITVVANLALKLFNRLFEPIYQRQRRAVTKWNLANSLEREAIIFGYTLYQATQGVETPYEPRRFEGHSFRQLPSEIQHFLLYPEPQRVHLHNAERALRRSMKPAVT